MAASEGMAVYNTMMPGTAKPYYGPKVNETTDQNELYFRSLGVTTYVLLTGFSPFGGETDQETFLNISKAQVDFPDELFEDVSEDAQDFVKRLLVRNPSLRMTAKECLRHPWLAANRKRSPPNNQKPLPNRTQPTSESRRSGCQSCSSSSNKSLRKYLSKSREALFERIISQQRLHSSMSGDLRKNTLLLKYTKMRRLCESQMSLISKAKELTNHQALTRSREKLYGLRSLSKSHEVLNLYKSFVNLQQIEIHEEETQKSPEERTESDEKENQVMESKEGNDEQAKAPFEPEDKSEVPSMERASMSESDISEEDSTGKVELSAEEDEPRYTVAQLISAYNMHQEIVTKTSLEVTMNSGTSQLKIPPFFDKTKSHKFPTGPNALRLFIPNINISSIPKSDSCEEKLESSPECSKKDDRTSPNLVVEAPPAKYLRATPIESNGNSKPESPESGKILEEESKTGLRPSRKSFSTPTPPQDLSQVSDKVRRKSSPPTMKPEF